MNHWVKTIMISSRSNRKQPLRSLFKTAPCVCVFCGFQSFVFKISSAYIRVILNEIVAYWEYFWFWFCYYIKKIHSNEVCIYVKHPKSTKFQLECSKPNYCNFIVYFYECSKPNYCTTCNNFLSYFKDFSVKIIREGMVWVVQ